MRCPKCGRELDGAAKFCPQCGTGLDATAASPSGDEKDGAPNGAKAPADAPSAAPTAGAADGLARAASGIGGVVARLGKRGVAIACGVALVAVVAIVAVVVMTSCPSDADLEDFIRNEASLSWPYAGTYDSDASYEVSSIDIISKEHADVDSTMGFLGVDDCYTIAATVRGANGSADAELAITFDWIHWNGEWGCTGLSSCELTSARATQGVDEAKLTTNALTVLDAAGSDTIRSQDYRDGSATVSDVSFDEGAQTCTATIDYTSPSPYAVYTATAQASFSFDSGRWQLDSATAEGSDAPSYDAILGTWTGTFTEQPLYRGATCDGAKSHDLTVTITSVDADAGTVEGTFSGLAHDHGPLEAEADSTDGDAMTDEIPFTARLSNGLGVGGTYVSVSASVVNPSDSSSKLTLTVNFGVDDDPSAVAATLETDYKYSSTPFMSPASFRDTYTLTKSE